MGNSDNNSKQNINAINWYPGHMTKAFRSMQEDIKLIDLVIEITDARLPISSRNPDIDKLANGKARIIILNKADLADERCNKAFKEYFEEKGFTCILLDSRKNESKKPVIEAINIRLAEKRERDKKRGIQNRPIRVLICGIPNVGKSTLINSLASKSVTKTGNKPGVTKGNQWVKIGQGIELLDTPGILWPKFEDREVGLRLALAGSINDNIINLNELVSYGIEFLCKNYPGALNEKYGINELDAPYEIITEIAVNRNLIKQGAEPDISRAERLFLDDLRSSALGKITFEFI